MVVAVYRACAGPRKARQQVGVCVAAQIELCMLNRLEAYSFGPIEGFRAALVHIVEASSAALNVGS